MRGRRRYGQEFAAGRAARGGFTLPELLVASTLLVSVISVVTQLTVRTGRLRQDTRHYIAAIEEASNQLDRLTALDDQRRAQQLAELTPSETIGDLLPAIKLTGEEIDDDDGRRIVLRLSWGPPLRRTPLVLVAWVDARPQAAPTPPEEVAP